MPHYDDPYPKPNADMLPDLDGPPRYWDDDLDLDPVPSFEYSVPEQPGRMSRFVDKFIDRWEAVRAIPDRKERLKRQIAVVALSALAQVTVLGAGAFAAHELTSADSVQDQDRTEQTSTDESDGPDTSVESTDSGDEMLETLPEQNFEVFDVPFSTSDQIGGWAPGEREALEEATFEGGDDAALDELLSDESQGKSLETHNIESINEMVANYGNEFLLAMRATSGVQLNIYTDVSDPQQQIQIDPEAFDRLLSLSFDTIQEAPDSPFRTAALEFARLAEQGMLENVTFHVVISSEANNCIVGNSILSENGFIPEEPDRVIQFEDGQVYEPADNDCTAEGIAYSISGYSAPARYANVGILIPTSVLSEGSNTFNVGNAGEVEIENPMDYEMAVVTHEIVGHGSLQALNQTGSARNLPLSVDKEHNRFVYPLELRIMQRIGEIENGSALFCPIIPSPVQRESVRPEIVQGQGSASDYMQPQNG